MSRIRTIEAWPVNVPLEATYLMAPGRYPGITRTVIRVTTSDGVVGLGESPSPDDAVALAGGLGAELLNLDVAEARGRLATDGPVATTARSDARVVVRNALAGVELALWDAEARELGRPLHALLGERCRDGVAFTEYFAYRLGRESTPEEIAAYCAEMVAEHGSPAFEGKLGVHPVAEELHMAGLVRRAIGPDRELRFDVNMGWSRDTARAALPVLEELRVANLEEPVSSFVDLAALRSVSAIPFSAHAPDLDGAVAHGVPDALVLGVAACGGLAGTLAFVARCRAAGVGFWFYSGDLGIATAASLHVAAVTPWIDRPSQSLRRWTTDDVVAEGPFAPEHGVLPVPDGPGLGVHLDEQALARGVERFARDGEYSLYADARLPRY